MSIRRYDYWPSRITERGCREGYAGELSVCRSHLDSFETEGPPHRLRVVVGREGIHLRVYCESF